MRTVRFRLTGDTVGVQATLASVHALDQVDRVEEVADQGVHARDDSSSAGLDEDMGGDFHDNEVHAQSHEAATRVRECVEMAARDNAVALEFVERF